MKRWRGTITTQRNSRPSWLGIGERNNAARERISALTSRLDPVKQSMQSLTGENAAHLDAIARERSMLDRDVQAVNDIRQTVNTDSVSGLMS